MHEALERLKASFKALAETRQLLFDELEKSTGIVSQCMESVAGIIEHPDTNYHLDQADCSSDVVSLLAQTGNRH